MASSVFADSPVSTNETRMCGDSQSNLVVVYGKNGLNVDRSGLDSLLEDRNVSSVSVVRITSPTPSMKDEKEEKNENEMDGDEGDLESSLEFPTKNAGGDAPEIVGLTVEEFYPPEEAKKLAKEILNYAGVVNPLQIKIDYEFQRFVIQNDHCYTPLTSPSQVKPKPTPVSNSNESKPVILRQYANSRTKKLSEPTEAEDKSDSKEPEEEEEFSEYSESSFSDTDNDRDSDLDFNVNDRGRRGRKASTRKTRKSLTKTPKKRQSNAEKDHPLLMHSISVEEEKKTVMSPKANRQNTMSIPINKPQPKLVAISKPVVRTFSRQVMPESEKAENSEEIKHVVVPQEQVKRPQVLQDQAKRSVLSQDISKRSLVQADAPKRSPVVPQDPLQRLVFTTKPKYLLSQDYLKRNSIVRDQTKRAPNTPEQLKRTLLTQEQIKRPLTTPEQPKRTLITQTETKQPTFSLMPSEIYTETEKPIPTKQEPNHQTMEKNLFSDVSALFNRKETKPGLINIISDQKINQPLLTNLMHITRQVQQPPLPLPPPSKGFMPLEVDSASKNQLPAQISIQTHTSCSELAAEHDKQLDLIDSIVKDEMEKKTNIIVKDPMNENIPQIVKMLENTEKAVLSNSKALDIVRIPTSSATSNNFSNPVEDIDITNAPLLDNAEDELTEDLLQHVAELMDNKSLQEVSEKQVLELNTSPQLTIVNTATSASHCLLSTTSTIPQNILQSPIQSSPSLEAIPLTTPITMLAQNQPIMKEPIQIVRGNGRVITLPPIEAPTTRAKRRAQSQHVTGSPVHSKPAPIKPETGQRRESVDQKGTRKRASVSSQSAPKEDDFESTEAETSDSEDDPNRLWCICRQPHNNRFMICCDKCEDWFHGKCVNITKGMGLEMEQNGIEWTCPKCLKGTDPQQKKPLQRKITEIFDKKTNEEIKKAPESKKPASTPATPSSNSSASTPISSFISKKLQIKKPSDTIIRKSNETMLKKVDNQPIRPLKQSVLKVIEVLNKNNPEITTSPEARTKNVEQKSEPVPLLPVQENTDPSLSCIVCRKIARPNSIYCSDDCIRRHAQNALNTATKAMKAATAATSPHSPSTPGDEKKKRIPSSFEEALAKAAEPTLPVKNKIERVYVFERKSGRLLTGANAPTTANLKKWLQENPTFEVITPGSPQAIAIDRNKQKQKAAGIITQSNESFEGTPHKKTHTIIKIMRDQSSELKTLTPKLLKYPQQVTLKPGNMQPATPVKILKKQPSIEQKPAQTPTPSPTANKEIEPIRLNVKRTLKEQLIFRMNELKTQNIRKLTVAEIEEFSNETENEMFKLFNKDAGTKYKAKYRSLMFNIKDRKNQTLFQNICEKKIEPKQLVRMSPEELASQELAQWRQNENKHQLEMIKKSELDLLSCAKNYVLKTHKGEEVIESKSTDRVSLDITIPVEDVVTVLNSSAVSSSSETAATSPSKDPNKIQLMSDGSQDADSSVLNSSLPDSNKSGAPHAGEKKKSRSKDKDRDRHYRPKEKHKSRRKSRSRSRERRQKSPPREEKRDTTSREPVNTKDEKRESKDEKKEPTGNKEEKREAVNKEEKRESNLKEEKKEEKLIKKEKQDIKAKMNAKSKEREIKVIKIQKPDPALAKRDYNLIDKILESTKTVEEAANLVDKTKVDTKPQPSPAINSKQSDSTTNIDSDQEPTSTVNITSSNDVYSRYSSDSGSTIWKGSINMIDVATFQISIQSVSGITNDLRKDLPNELDVVGRISPDTVWDYISKIRKSPNKEIVIIRLSPSCESENTAYSALYMYLDKRKRLGVVKTISPNIKDFYILPLGSNRTLPTILQTQETMETLNEDQRPDLLLGIVIRIMGKRPGLTVHHSQPKVARKTLEASVISNMTTLEEEHYTPPHSPKSQKKLESKSIISATRLPPKIDDPIDINSIITPSPKISKGYNVEDADEPYSPGGSDDDLGTLPTTMRSSTAVDPMTDELKRKMDEINRQIEAQKMEIAGMLNMEQNAAVYSPSRSPTSFNPTLANISIPSNLQQILASIKTAPSEPTTSVIPPPPVIGSLLSLDDDDDEEYVPEAPKTLKTLAVPTPPPPPALKTNSSSRLAQLSEAELLSMVPDDIELTATSTKDKPSTSGLSSTNKSGNSSPILLDTAAKKPRWESEPPPPGLEEEFM